MRTLCCLRHFDIIGKVCVGIAPPTITGEILGRLYEVNTTIRRETMAPQSNFWHFLQQHQSTSLRWIGVGIDLHDRSGCCHHSLRGAGGVRVLSYRGSCGITGDRGGMSRCGGRSVRMVDLSLRIRHHDSPDARYDHQRHECDNQGPGIRSGRRSWWWCTITGGRGRIGYLPSSRILLILRRWDWRNRPLWYRSIGL